MIVFSQSITHHSRIGNSLTWMSRAAAYCKLHSIDFYFPNSFEQFAEYLDPNSIWLNLVNKHKAEKLLFDLGFDGASAEKITYPVRGLQHEYEKQNHLAAFEWQYMVYEICNGRGVLLCGDLLESDISLAELNNKYELVLMHEPFPFLLPFSETSEDFLSVAPSEVLVDSVNSFFKNSIKIRVGFHIRRGDYAEWSGGKFYFSDDFWVNLANELLSEEVEIYIFSNELSESLRDRLKDRGCIVVGGSYSHEFVMLMFMNKIYGPPSTFTAMPSQLARHIFNNDIDFFHLNAD